jgi:hypothetical protein
MPTKKQKFTAVQGNSLLSQGAWNKLPYRAVIGDQNAFYLWRHKDAFDRGSNTVWIRGREAFDLLAQLKQKIVADNLQFVAAFDQAFDRRPKM